MWGYRWARSILLARRFRRTYGAAKAGVLVYSDSPSWKDHFEQEVLPRLEGRLVTLNWSRRSEWVDARSLPIEVFQHWAGDRDFNPLAILIPARGAVQTIRFHAAFKAHKHGKPAALREAERRLFQAAGVAVPDVDG